MRLPCGCTLQCVVTEVDGLVNIHEKDAIRVTIGWCDLHRAAKPMREFIRGTLPLLDPTRQQAAQQLLSSAGVS